VAQVTLTDAPELDEATVLDDELATPLTPLVLIAGLAMLVLLLWTLIWGVVGPFR
jgi:hypothetical protein